MINLFLVIAGIVMLAHSLSIHRKIIHEIKKGIDLKYLSFLQYLIIFFLAGYLSYLYLLFLDLKHGNLHLIISLVFFFGSVFVVLIFRINYDLIVKINEHEASLEKSNRDLAENNKELEKIKGELKDKNKELERTLEDFYTIRISMAEQAKSGAMKKENKLIKERIDRLKKS